MTTRPKRTKVTPIVDTYKPVTREDVTDLALLPRRFDRFASEMRTHLDVLGQQLLPAINRLDASTKNLEAMVTAQNHDLTNVSKRVAANELAIAAIKEQLATRERAKRKARK